MTAERSAGTLGCVDSAVAAAAAASSSSRVPTAGWDSDLTQGGQVFSGSVSSVLRRHKQGLSSGDHIDAQLRQLSHYAGVLETLDQARQMDTTAASAVVSPLLDDRVRQWRTETAGERHSVGSVELHSDAPLQSQQQQRCAASPLRQQRHVSSGARTPPTKRTSAPVCLQAIDHHNSIGDCNDAAEAVASPLRVRRPNTAGDMPSPQQQQRSLRAAQSSNSTATTPTTAAAVAAASMTLSGSFEPSSFAFLDNNSNSNNSSSGTAVQQQQQQYSPNSFGARPPSRLGSRPQTASPKPSGSSSGAQQRQQSAWEGVVSLELPLPAAAVAAVPRRSGLNIENQRRARGRRRHSVVASSDSEHSDNDDSKHGITASAAATATAAANDSDADSSDGDTPTGASQSKLRAAMKQRAAQAQLLQQRSSNS
eukprot:2071-Heterococcus_DN1.PRE.1